MTPIFKLFQNYRSLPSILNFYNTQFYDSSLVAMIDGKTSSDAKTLARFNTIFLDANQSSEYGIHFVDVNGKNVVRKHSWANILEAQVVSNCDENPFYSLTFGVLSKLNLFLHFTIRLKRLSIG